VQASGAVHDTACSEVFLAPAGLGMLCRLQAEPFQDSARVSEGPPGWVK
jgi:hypothetical protein